MPSTEIETSNEDSEYTRFLFDQGIMSEIALYAEKYDRSHSEIIMLGLRLFKLMDQFKEEDQDLAIIKKGTIVRKIILT